MSNFDYEYFCGANVLVFLNDFPILECAGLSYEIMENRIPIYAYNARHFNTVGRGHVLVRGELAVNYIHQDYLHMALEFGRRKKRLNVADEPIAPLPTFTEIAKQLKELDLDAISSDYSSIVDVAEVARETFWPTQRETGNSIYTRRANLHDHIGSTVIRATFGDQNEADLKYGKTSVEIRGVHFLGRSKSIEISENNIIEVYPFIGRNVHTLQNPIINRPERA